MNRLQIVNGEICYLSEENDQSYGMWVPVNYDTPHNFKECEYLVPESSFSRLEEDLNEQLRIKDIVMKNLERQLMLSTDQNDLVLDEFVRVKLLTDNEEIHALCERAHVRMRQNVPVIERNHTLNERAKRQSRHLVKLIDIAQEALNMAGKAQHGDLVFVGADPKFAKQSLQKRLDEFKSMYKDEG